MHARTDRGERDFLYVSYHDRKTDVCDTWLAGSFSMITKWRPFLLWRCEKLWNCGANLKQREHYKICSACIKNRRHFCKWTRQEHCLHSRKKLRLFSKETIQRVITKVSSAIAEIKTAHILCQTYYTEILKQCGLFCVAHWHYFHQLQSFFQNILIDTWCDMHSKVGRFVYFDSFIYAAVEIRNKKKIIEHGGICFICFIWWAFCMRTHLRYCTACSDVCCSLLFLPAPALCNMGW